MVARNSGGCIATVLETIPSGKIMIVMKLILFTKVDKELIRPFLITQRLEIIYVPYYLPIVYKQWVL